MTVPSSDHQRICRRLRSAQAVAILAGTGPYLESLPEGWLKSPALNQPNQSASRKKPQTEHHTLLHKRPKLLRTSNSESEIVCCCRHRTPSPEPHTAQIWLGSESKSISQSETFVPGAVPKHSALSLNESRNLSVP